MATAMTFLQILQRTAEKCGLSQPTTVLSLTGEQLRLRNYAQEQWLSLQRMRKDWQWMWVTKEITLTADDATYSDSIDYKYVNPHSFTAYDSGDGEASEWHLRFLDYMSWRRFYDIGTHTSTRPTLVAQKLDNTFVFYPPPDEAYKVQFDYYAVPTELTVADATEPSLPNHFHMILVYMATQQWAMYQQNAELLATMESLRAPMFSELLAQEVPRRHVRIQPWA